MTLPAESFSLSLRAASVTSSHVVGGLVMKYNPLQLVRIFFNTLWLVRYSLLTIVLMLALGSLTRYSGTDTTLGLAFANTGMFYPFFGTLMGWLGVALTGALAGSLFPVLAAVSHDRHEMLRRFDRAVIVNVLPVALVIALQAAMAPIYVPLIFGAQWAHAAWLVALICISSLTRPAADAAAQLLRAAGLPKHELAGAAVVTAVQIGAFAIGIAGGLTGAVAALATMACASNLAFAIWARRVLLADTALAKVAVDTQQGSAVRPEAQLASAS